MKEDILTILLASLDELNSSEGKVAQYVLANPEEVVHLSIALLSQKAGVSEPTVIRFCRSLGYSGYQNFKIQLATGLASSHHPTSNHINDSDSFLQITNKICSNSGHTLQKLPEILEVGDIEQALALLSSATKIELYGSGNSGLVAFSAQQQLGARNLPIRIHGDSHFQKISATNLKKDHLAFIISASGDSATSLEIAKTAQQQGATVLGLTPKNTSLSQYCHTTLGCPQPEEEHSASSTITMLCQLTIINILATSLSCKKSKR